MSVLSISISTCVNTEQPGANERSKCLAWFGQQGNHPKQKCRRSLLPPIDDKILIYKVRNNQFQQLARPLCEHPVTGRKRRSYVPQSALREDKHLTKICTIMLQKCLFKSSRFDLKRCTSVSKPHCHVDTSNTAPGLGRRLHCSMQ